MVDVPRLVRATWPHSPPRPRHRGRGGEDGTRSAARTPALSSAAVARRSAAATIVEALAGGSPLVVELGEVGGEGRILEPVGRRAGGAPRSTPGGCSGRARPRARRRALERDRLAAAILHGRARSAMGDAPSAPERKRRPVRPALAAGAFRRCAAATLRSGGLGVSRGRRRQPALPMSVTPLHARPSANSSGRDQRQTVDSGSTSRKSSSVQTSAVSSNSDTKVSASGPATR